jgi:hypothetical protein
MAARQGQEAAVGRVTRVTAQLAFAVGAVVAGASRRGGGFGWCGGGERSGGAREVRWERSGGAWLGGGRGVAAHRRFGGREEERRCTVIRAEERRSVEKKKRNPR